MRAWFKSLTAPRTVVIANAVIIMNVETIKYRKSKKYKFTREKLKFGTKKTFGRKPKWMGDIVDDVSHFLCPDHSIWLPSQRYEITLEEKRDVQREIADRWRKGLIDGTYDSKADIARKNRCSRAWVTRLLQREFSFA